MLASSWQRWVAQHPVLGHDRGPFRTFAQVSVAQPRPPRLHVQAALFVPYDFLYRSYYDRQRWAEINGYVRFFILAACDKWRIED